MHRSDECHISTLREGDTCHIKPIEKGVLNHITGPCMSLICSGRSPKAFCWESSFDPESRDARGTKGNKETPIRPASSSIVLKQNYKA